MEQSKVIVMQTDKLVPAVGPFCFGKIVQIPGGQFAYPSGQIGLVLETKKLVDDSVEKQAHQSITNLINLLTDNGFSVAHIIKCNVYLTDMDHFAAINTVYASYFGEALPARTCVAVKQLPLGAKFEIECVAFKSA